MKIFATIILSLLAILQTHAGTILGTVRAQGKEGASNEHQDSDEGEAAAHGRVRIRGDAMRKTAISGG